MKKILIADDEALIRKLISDFLKKADMEAIEAEDGKEALTIFRTRDDIDLIIVDIMMPRLNGWDLCREIRKTSDVPIIMLSARSEEFDELEGFEAGINEYVVKPFRPAVLIKRIEALISLHEGTGINKNTDKELYVDKEAYVAYLFGEPLELTSKEFEILYMLDQNKNKVITREQILDNVWGYDYYGNIRTVDSHVGKLRLKLGEYGDIHLKTIYGVGYKLVD